jgi:putative hydrolase of the HAD superfamily
MAIKAVVFDWGGTLTPWHNVDLTELWLGYSRIYDPENAQVLAEKLNHGEQARWSRPVSYTHLTLPTKLL